MKVAIVTGGANGIGRAIAFKLLSDDCLVIVLDSCRESLDKLEQDTEAVGFNVVAMLCDVGNPAEVETVMKEIKSLYGEVDYLVNNAGVSIFKPIDELSIGEWNDIISTNLSGMFYCVKFVKPFLSTASAIVNIASIRAVMSEPDGEAYGASKGGIVALTHALAVSLSPKTRVNCVSPGWIEVKDYENLSEADHTQHPAGRVGYPDDVAETVAHLLSEKAGFITGQNIVIDGGMTKKMIYT
jgi:Dehydrogenases with different specificities (related to short-chain alcohol dehydrogenases)